jgi:hypothetical protein
MNTQATTIEPTVAGETAKAFLECPYRSRWAHLGFGSCAEALLEIERLKVENRDLRRVFEQATVAFREKEAEIKGLKVEIEVLRHKLRDQLQQPFTRNTDKEENAANQEQTPAGQANQSQKERKKRGAPKGHRGATRKKPDRPPDRTILVNPCQCPECQSRNISICQETEEHTQEDLILPRPIVTRYLKKRGYCRDCGTLFFPTGAGERPNGYLGPVPVALAGFMRYVIKIPFASVRKIFAGVWGLDITPPAIVGFEKELAKTGRPFYEQIADLIKTSLALNLDETSWWERDILQWLWTFVAQNQVLFKIAATRSGDVIREVLGPVYQGVLSSDCFSAYNTIAAQAKQKCLAHYACAAKELEKFYPNDQATLLFAVSLRDISKRDWLEGIITTEQAAQQALAFEEELDQLVETPLQNLDAEKLRNRLITHRNENFTFLRYKQVEPDNNRAERALRPSVVMRKITYGNNSATGVFNHETLMSLVETAKLNNANPLDLMMCLAGADDQAKIKTMLFTPNTS